MKLWNNGKDSSLFKYGESDNRKIFYGTCTLSIYASYSFSNFMNYPLYFVAVQRTRSSLLRGNVNYVAKKSFIKSTKDLESCPTSTTLIHDCNLVSMQ
jgi:hypothetical protein